MGVDGRDSSVVWGQAPWARAGVIAVALGVFAWALWNTAWLCDDAYLSFRAADNLVHGYGLRWNVIERVQAFTNPLWTLLNAGAYALTEEGYLTFIGVGAAVSLAGFAVVVGWPRRSVGGMLVVACWLIFSRAYVDYSTSGLENPLTHLLVGVFVWEFLGRGRPWVLGVLAGLAACNRADTVLLFVPALVYGLRGPDRVAVARAYARGMAPLAAWLLFSLVYYGTPFPNTAYTKLGGAIPLGDRLAHGWEYVAALRAQDPVTLSGILAGLVCAAAMREGRKIALGLGVLAYVGYVVLAGGDFMLGRMFSGPFVLAVALAGLYPALGRWWGALPVCLLLIVVAWGQAVVSVVPHTDFAWTRNFAAERFAIADERRYYFQTMGLAPLLKEGKAAPRHAWALNALAERTRGGGPRVVSKAVVGMWGFFGGPELHIVDPMALGDPFLSRLPAVYNPGWRAGHLWRAVPEGYEASALEAQSGVTEPALAALDNLVRAVVRGPVWSVARWRAIWVLTQGRWHEEIAPLEDGLRFPYLHRVYYAALPRTGTEDDVTRGTRFWPGGLEVVLGERRHDAYAVAGIAGQRRCRALFMDGDVVVGQADFPGVTPGELGVKRLVAAVPGAVQAGGYTAVRVVPFTGLEFECQFQLAYFALAEVADT